ncbi:MAG: hypothetical protein RLY78_4265 [Pseudomonadota bacterium]
MIPTPSAHLLNRPAGPPSAHPSARRAVPRQAPVQGRILARLPGAAALTLGAALALLAAPARAQTPAPAPTFRLISPTIADGGTLPKAQVFQGFGCEGGDQSPALVWSGAPAGTRSFVLTVYDPDAPTGSGWWHWVLADLPADLGGLPAGAGAASAQGLPAGAWQGRNDYGSHAFGGACPPPGDRPHRYVFTLHALKVERLGVPADASAALIGYMTRAHSLGQAAFTATYGR